MSVPDYCLHIVYVVVVSCCWHVVCYLMPPALASALSTFPFLAPGARRVELVPFLCPWCAIIPFSLPSADTKDAKTGWPKRSSLLWFAFDDLSIDELANIFGFLRPQDKLDRPDARRREQCIWSLRSRVPEYWARNRLLQMILPATDRRRVQPTVRRAPWKWIFSKWGRRLGGWISFWWPSFWAPWKWIFRLFTQEVKKTTGILTFFLEIWNYSDSYFSDWRTWGFNMPDRLEKKYNFFRAKRGCVKEQQWKLCSRITVYHTVSPTFMNVYSTSLFNESL